MARFLGKLFPARRRDARLRRCTVPAPARLVALADDRRRQDADVALLRLAVARPDGVAETCVRQHVPYELGVSLRLGDELAALAHEQDPAIAVVDWEATGRARGVRASPATTADRHTWPDAPDWPAPGTVAVHDAGRHLRRLARRRAQGTPAWAALVGAASRGSLTDLREDWTLTLELDGRRVEIAERMPWLATARLIERVKGRPRLAGVATGIQRRPRAGARVAVLVGPDDAVSVDWERTLTALLAR